MLRLHSIPFNFIYFAFTIKGVNLLTAPKKLGSIYDFRNMVFQLGEAKALLLLGVHRTTLRRWLSGSVKVPRYAVLALYWETSWGRALVDADRQYIIALMNYQIEYLRTENDRLIEAIEALENSRKHDAANFPIFTYRKAEVFPKTV